MIGSGSEKKRFTAALTITAENNFLTPYLIFKVQKNSIISMI